MSVLVGKQAPNFTAQVVEPDGSFAQLSLENLRGKYVLLFFYPLDFTFVCPSEIIAFHNHLGAFEERGVQVLGASVDSHFSHHAWRNTPVAEGGIGPVGFPLIADLTKSIARDYDVLTPDGAVAYRGLFLIDREGIVRHQVVNDLPLGRKVEEALRMVDALQFTEQHGEVCPANWTPGKAAMKPDAAGVASYLSANAASL
jgi:peroxiredoxin (alkyl hydroperoxide reductase subunit C)